MLRRTSLTLAKKKVKKDNKQSNSDIFEQSVPVERLNSKSADNLDRTNQGIFISICTCVPMVCDVMQLKPSKAPLA